MKAIIGTAVFALAIVCASVALADTPCDFKGLSVGDKATPASVMAAFGIARFKIDPPKDLFKTNVPAIEKYGLADASDMEDWKIGPYCEPSICIIPYGVTVGNNSTPVKVVVGINKGIVTEIDVAFDLLSWDELLAIINNKYGNNWKTQTTPDVITDLVTKKHEQIERIFLSHRNDGIDRKTNSKCQIWMSNYDIVFVHHGPLGPYQSQFVIKLVSKNF